MPKITNTPHDNATNRGTTPRPSGAPLLDANVADAVSEDIERREIQNAFIETDALETNPSGASTVEQDNNDLDNSHKKEPIAKDGKDAVQGPDKHANGLTRFFLSYWRHKKWALPLTTLLVCGVVFAIPATRYPVLATFMKKDVSIVVSDRDTRRPVGSAIVTIDGASVMTDNAGRAMVRAKVGSRLVSVNKKYYSASTTEILVAVSASKKQQRVVVSATGRQVPLFVLNKITGKPIENVLVKSSGTEVITDKDGKATLVLPAGAPSLEAFLSGKGFNNLKVAIAVTELPVSQNTFQLTPNGKVYLLSKQSGKIDVVKTDLDGANRQTAIAGTGREEDRNTILLASRDWRYLALYARRDSDRAKLYLIDTATDKMTVMDEGDANFEMIGWSDSTFVYQAIRNTTKEWQSNRQALKAFSATNMKLSTLDQSEAEGDQSAYNAQDFGNFYLLNDRVVYVAQWTIFGNFGAYGVPDGSGAAPASKSLSIRSVHSNGQNKKDLKTFPSNKFYGIGSRQYGPEGIYFSVYNGVANKQESYDYESGAVKPAAIDEVDFNQKTYPRFLISPSDKKTFWSEQRDGQGTFFVGDRSAANPKQIATLDEYQVYGWYGDDYVLVSKKNSEIYIMSSSGLASGPSNGPSAGLSIGKSPLKITAYHKPTESFRGFSGGYGGL